MSRKRTKQYLMLLMVIGLVSVAAGGSGTFASFSAETANTGNIFSTGTLYLHDTVQGGTGTCTSESAQSNSNLGTTGVHLGDSCDALFDFSATPGSNGPHSVGIARKNAGTLDASGMVFQLGSGGCTVTEVYDSNTTVDVAGYVPGTDHTTLPISPATLAIPAGGKIQIKEGATTETATTAALVPLGATSITLTADLTNSYTSAATVKSSPHFSGAGSLCDDLSLSITETDDPTYANVTVNSTTGATSSTTGATKCVFGTASGNGCASPADALSSLPVRTSDTVLGSTDPLNLDATIGGNTGTPAHTGIDAGNTRYFVIVLLANTTDNAEQGQAANFDVVWHMDQV